MQSRGVTVKVLADRLGVSEAYVSQLRNGSRRATRTRAADRQQTSREAIAEAIGVPVDWIETRP